MRSNGSVQARETIEVFFPNPPGAGDTRARHSLLPESMRRSQNQHLRQRRRRG